MSFPDTGLALTLRVGAARVADVQIRSGRLVQAARLLAGKTPAQVALLLPGLFSLCGTAQGAAAAAAWEDAAGISPSPAQRMARRWLVLVETISEYGQSILRDWPALLGEAPDLAAVKPLRPMVAAARQALYPKGDWASPGGGSLIPQADAVAALRHRMVELVGSLLAGLGEDAAGDPTDFLEWAAGGKSVAARLIHRVAAPELAAFGHAPPRFMAEGGPRDLSRRLAEDKDGTYVAAPDSAGLALETTVLTRHFTHPLVAALMERHGLGLLPRFAARLVGIAAALREAEELVQDLAEDPSPAQLPLGQGNGLGVVDAARGLLAHRVELKEGLVRRYQILAPTEWNFHPQGALARGLAGVAATPDLEWRARTLVAALDPCVACTVEVAPHA